MFFGAGLRVGFGLFRVGLEFIYLGWFKNV